jgi:HD superfamily phosphohydrolase
MPSQRDKLLERLRQDILANYVLSTLSAELIPLPAARVQASKEINDPIWKIIRLSPLEVCLLDTPLMQRLRGVRQLGLAHLVYPGASHTRLEHSIGVCHAARRMLGLLVGTMSSSLDEVQRLSAQTIVGVAGLLHDSGHVAFSHVGENVLEDVLRSSFDTIRTIFAETFSGLVKVRRSDGRPSAPHPRPGELLSALLAISQPMIDLLNRQGELGLPAEDMTTTVSALILGYAPETLIFNKQYLYFIKDVITGDIDSDKIDYVARDGYFAGVPLAVDVERLLSQLIAIDLPFPSLSPAPMARDVEHLYAIGLKPTGASAMEMLVLTRVYLFDRIYLHQKVKAAERFCESILRSYVLWLVQQAVLAQHPEATGRDLQTMMEQSYGEPSTIARVVAALMRPGGDDGLLATIADLKNDSNATAREIGDAAHDLLFRHLPTRALPVALRASARTDLPSGDRTAKINWPHLKLTLARPEGKTAFEDRVIAFCGDEQKLLFDYANRRPVPEDPDIWVRTSPEALPERLNKHFSVEQLSNAYLELKETGWVFCSRANQAKVAAATGIALYEQFGIIPSAHGLELAKLSAEAYDTALDQYFLAGTVDRNVIDALKLKAVTALLVVHPFEIRNYLPSAWTGDEIEQTARKFSQDLNRVQLPASAGVEWTILLPLFRMLLLHARRSHDKFGRWAMRPSDVTREKFFANDLFEFLQQREIESEFLPFVELRNQPGRIDLAFIHRRQQDVKIVVELKSEDNPFSRMVDEHAGQSMAYCTHEFARISILYSQFGGDSVRLSDAIQIRQLRADETGGSSPSKLVAICIGHRGFGGVPSVSGRQSAPV